MEAYMTKHTQVTVTADSAVFPFYGELGTTNLDSLSRERYGIYQQSKSGNVYSGLNYPVDSPGSLMVLPTGEGGCTQEYRPSDSNALYRRRYYLVTFMWCWSSWCQEYNSENWPSVGDEGVQGRADFPAGALLLWPSSCPPAGWLVCDGSSFSCAEYPLLASLFPDGKLPELNSPGQTYVLLRYITRAV